MNLLRTNLLPYHVTARCNNREPFALPLERQWEILSNECYLATICYGIEIHALVLMPNHFHLVLTVPEYDLGKVMNGFMSNITRTSNLLSGRSGRIFGAPYHRSVVNSAIYFAHVIKYVYRNPVKAGLCERVEFYPWSTLHGLLGESPLPFPVFEARSGLGMSFLPERAERLLRWLNRPFPREADVLIKRALSKSLFAIPKDRNTRTAETVLEELI